MSFEGKKRYKALSPIQKARLIFQSALRDSIKDLGKDKANDAWRKEMIAEQIAAHLGLIDYNTPKRQANKIIEDIIN